MDHMLLTDEERLELIKRVREDVYMEDVILKTEAGKLLYE